MPRVRGGGPQCVLVPRKIGELELEFEIPTWNSNWDFEEFTVKFTVNFTNEFTTNFINYNITPKNQKTKQFFLSFFLFLFLSFPSFPFLSFLPSLLFFFKFQLYFNIH